jgi:TonB family protein
MKYLSPFNKSVYFLTLLATVQLSFSSLSGAEIDGFWKFTEDSIQEITAFTVASSKTQGGDAVSAEETSDSYRNHLREFKLTEENKILIRLIQFAQARDKYPEYIRKYNLDYATSENEAFTISNGEREVFTGRVTDDSIHLKDAGSGKTLELEKVSMNDYPFLTEKVFEQGQLDRKPKAKKLTTPIYPPNLQESGIEGKVEIEFKVNQDGTTSEIQIISSPHDAFSSAAIDAIRTSTFRPGQIDRKPVRTHVKLPIYFR